MASRKRRVAEPSDQANEDMMNALRQVVSTSMAPIMERLDNLEQLSRASSSNDNIEVPNLDIMPRHDNSVLMVQTPTKPTFDGNNVHPIIFLDDLESYITRIRAQRNDLKVTLDCLTGEARGWARIFIPNWKGFNDFKTDFLDQYWGRKMQNNIRMKIANGKWDPSKTKTMLGHFIRIYDEAKMLSQLDERELINQIIDHFPQEIRRMWYKDGGGGAEAAVRFLKTMDMGSDDISLPKRMSIMSNSEKSKVTKTSSALEQVQRSYQKSWNVAGSQSDIIELENSTDNHAEN